MPRTRNQTRQNLSSSHQNLKRAALESPGKAAPQRKRSAFGDITNAISHVVIDSSKKKLKPVKVPAFKKSSQRRSGGRQSLSSKKEDLTTIPEALISAPNGLSAARKSTSADTSTVSGLSSAPSSADKAKEQQLASQNSSSSSDSEIEYHNRRSKDPTEAPLPKLPEKSGTEHSASAEGEVVDYDYDAENLEDPLNVPHYAKDIFCYYKSREGKFLVGDYLLKQRSLTQNMRMILVDWMVEIQENFELNHETLYQAVKLTDLYLNKEPVNKENLQLVGSTALFLASKFDERCPPCSDDFLYICDDAYTREELFDMEQKMLLALDFDIGMPLSYRYLRRYAKASKVGMETLTLARYVLETSMMYYEFVSCSDSLIAAAAFLLALKMKKIGDWGEIQKKYSGYKVDEVEPLMWQLNAMLKKSPPPKSAQTILTKYSHEIFFQVAKIPALDG